MKQIQLKLSGFPQRSFSILPTPIYKLQALSEKYQANIFCQRDDLTGFAFGGNKTRKLDFLIADAMAKDYDTLLAVGANQSNFCRMTAAAGKVSGLEVHLLLSDEKPEKPTANLMLDHLFGAHVHHTNSIENKQVEFESEQLEAELSGKGKKVYRMPLGGSTGLGALGYVKGFLEIIDYSQKNNLSFDKIFLASGSGGTQAGLMLGKMLTGFEGQIIGISVGRSETELKSVVNQIVEHSCKLLHADFQAIETIVNDEFIGEAYGKPTPEGEMAIAEFANLEGILLDKVYTGKAAAAMLRFISTRKIKPGEKILFIHTGGNIELFE